MDNIKTKIKVVGVGGAGSNAISRMMKHKIEGIDLIAINTDIQDLRKTRAGQKLRIGRELTKGLGAGMNAEIGEKAAREQEDEISAVLKGADIVFIAAGFGGGTGTGASSVIAELSKKQGALTIAVVTTPFSFEGKQRERIAKKGLNNLRGKVDSLLVIPNNKILRQIDQDTNLVSALWSCDEVLRQAVEGITDLILLPGIINVDFADIKSVMESSGSALFGVGRSKGEKKVEEAVENAINSPLFAFPISGAKGVLFNISGGENLSLGDVNEAAVQITKTVARDAKIIFGAICDKKLQRDEIKITVIATGFKQR